MLFAVIELVNSEVYNVQTTVIKELTIQQQAICKLCTGNKSSDFIHFVIQQNKYIND